MHGFENMKKISIIVPIYNAEAKLPRCIESILAQTYGKIQIILIDDGSRDNSLTICRRYAERDPRILLLYHKNHGVSYTRNCGIDVADGDYLTFFDADDEVMPDMVQRYLEAAENYKADIVIGGIRVCTQNKAQYEVTPQKTGVVDHKELVETICAAENGIFGYAAGKLYRTSLIRKNGIRFREDMAAQEDLEFSLSAYRAGASFFLFPYCGYIYNYMPSGRIVPVKDLIGNQQKLLRLAEDVNADVSCCAKIADRIRGLTYTGLFNCKSEAEVTAIADIPGLKQDVAKYAEAVGEQRLILKLFLDGKHKNIFMYFCVRNKLKRLLGKK